jgi:hypothetical protein
MTPRKLSRQAAQGIPQMAERWLAPVAERLRYLIDLAERGTLTDRDFFALVATMEREAPTLLTRLDAPLLARQLEDLQLEAILTALE